MSSYITINHILPHIPLPILRDAFDDDGDGEIDLMPGEADGGSTVLDQLLEDCSQQVDALIASRYPSLPFAEPYPVAVVRSAHDFACEEIYRRRGIQDKDNPFKKQADTWREFLMRVSRGEQQLDANFPISLLASSGGQPYVAGRVPMPGSQTTY